ncbi:MAG TPA: ABC transporter substrate-binding protein [Thermomicrobiales bacterium]|nr:ABC transporter substrate-binding protein [Thermomicrobiales bacterium]
MAGSHVGISRRRMIALTTSTLVAAKAAPAAFAQDATPSGAWSFTDDKGVTVTLDAMPERLLIDVNAAAPLWDFGIRPVAVFGWNIYGEDDFGDAGGNIDPSTVEIAGSSTEPAQLEKMATTQPDLIITLTWLPDVPDDYWSIDPEILPLVQEIAPLLAMSATGNADVNTRRFAELAEALGADLSTPELAEAEEQYNAAIEALETTAAEKADLSVLFLYVDSEELYIASPPDWADLVFYQEAGVPIVEPEAEPGTFWEQLSMEQIMKYPADVIMSSTRPGTLTPEEIAEHPVLGLHPAAAAGQIYPWNQDFIQSYQGMTEALTLLTESLEAAEKIL